MQNAKFISRKKRILQSSAANSNCITSNLRLIRIEFFYQTCLNYLTNTRLSKVKNFKRKLFLNFKVIKLRVYRPSKGRTPFLHFTADFSSFSLFFNEFSGLILNDINPLGQDRPLP